MTKKDIDNIISIICPNDEDFEKPIISPAYLKKELEVLALEQKSCEDAISRKALKHKLQEHHDFFVNAYGGFSNLPQNDKSRVDEILNCIAMVVNEPSVKPQEKTGHWIWQTEDIYQCSECGENIHVKEVMNKPQYICCPICGCPMEIER